MTKQNKRILVVEDEYFLAEMLKMRFESLGYAVSCAENGAEALRVMETTPVNLIIMDLMMPVMDGIEATRQIKKNSKWKNIPILFLTARARPEDEKACYEGGADDYIAKPFETEILLSKVAKWMQK